MDHEQVARTLAAAYESGEPIEPPTSTNPGFSVDDAYRVQQLQVEAWQAEGRSVRGHKVGLTSRAMQAQLGVDQPDYGVLLADMFHIDGEPIPTGRFISPKVEAEIAFVLRKPLHGPGVTVADAVSAIDYAIASLEIIDSRIADWKISLADTIADNASSGGVVLGSTPRRLDGLELRTLGVVLRHNGAIAGTGAGAAVLGSPINALVWLANTVGRLGVELAEGDVVLPGALSAAISAKPGDTVSATFASLGTVTATFAV